MYDLGPQFNLAKEKFLANPKCIKMGEKYRITVLSESLLRLEYDTNGKFNDYSTPIVRNRLFPEPNFIVKEDPNFLNIETKYFSLFYVKNSSFSGKTLKVKMIGTNFEWCYGDKEYKNFKSCGLNIDNTDKLPNLEKGLYSPDGFVTIDDSKSILISENSNVFANKEKSIDLYLFMYNKDFGKCLKDYFILTGYPPMIPRYALGNWWSKEYTYDDKSLMETLDKFKYENIPLSVILLDNDWSKKDKVAYKNLEGSFSFNKTLFPNPLETIKKVHERGLRFGLKVNPYNGFYPLEDNYELAKKYVKVEKQNFISFNPYDARLLDIYFKIFLQPLKNMGVDLFWNDYNSKDKNSLFIINDLMYRDNKKQNIRGINLARNSGLAAHRYPILYSGHNLIDWKVLGMLPFYNANSANIGVSWWSHDVSGSTGGIEDSDFYIRSIQFGVFSPILRFHVEKGHFYKREPWKWDVVTSNIVTYYLQLRHRLIPYIYSEAYRYYKDGNCLIKPLYYNNIGLYDDPIYVNQYMFGDEIMISPIITATDPIINRTIQRMYMPDGVWYDFKNGKRFLGNHKYISFYRIEDYPIFVKAGSIIPLAGRDSYNNIGIPNDLDIHVFPGKSNNYYLYEDDGISNDYLEGKYLITEIDYNYRQSNYTVIIRAMEGDKKMIPEKRTYRIYFRNTKKADHVVVYENDQEIAYEIEQTENDFIVIVKDFNTANQLTVNCYGQDIEIDALNLIKDDIESILFDLKINTKLKDNIAEIIFSDSNLSKKRIGIRKLKRKGLDPRNIKLFLRLLEYMEM